MVNGDTLSGGQWQVESPPRVCNLGPVTFNIFIDDTEEGIRCALIKFANDIRAGDAADVAECVLQESLRPLCMFYTAMCQWTSNVAWKIFRWKMKQYPRTSKTGLPGGGTSHGSRLYPLNSTQSQHKNSLFQVPIKKAWREEKLLGARKCLKQLRIRNLMNYLDAFRNIFLCLQKANVQNWMPEDQTKA